MIVPVITPAEAASIALSVLDGYWHRRGERTMSGNSTPPRLKQPWTTADLRLLVRRYEEKVPPAEIARELGRTRIAVLQQASDMRTGRRRKIRDAPGKLVPAKRGARVSRGTGLDPAVVALADALDEKARDRAVMETLYHSGLNPHTVRCWIRGMRSPTIGNLRAALNAAGLDLSVVPLEK